MVDLTRFTKQPADRSRMPGTDPRARVYMDFFRFRCPPFAITPDPEFLFLSTTHQNAIEKIQYGIRTRQGFMLLTGEVGTGKSTLCRVILDLLQDDAETVYVITPSLRTEELFATILDDLGVPRSTDTSKKALIDQLSGHLLARSNEQPVVIIIDDAQGMSPETLEDMRLLSNLETDKEKLLQVLLVGQPELQNQIAAPRMRQLRQRIALNCRLDFLKVDEVGRYIERRLLIAGNHGQARFTPRLVKQIHKASQGIPRLINKVCDLTLTAAYTADSSVVDTHHLKAARHELVELADRRSVSMSKTAARSTGFFKLALAAGCLASVVFLGTATYLQRGQGVLSEPPTTRPHQGSAAIAGGEAIAPTVPEAFPVANPPAGAVGDAVVSIADAGDRTGGYILQLGSYKSLETTLRAVNIYAQRNIAAYWANLPEEGDMVWYRVYAGRFVTHQQARKFQQAHALPKAAVKFAPWTVAVGESGSTAQISALGELLRVHRLDGYKIETQDGRQQILSGAFLSRGGAEALADRIRRQTGLATRIAKMGGYGLPEGHKPHTQDKRLS